MARKKRLLWLISLGLVVLLIASLICADRLTEPFAHWTPDYEMQDLETLLQTSDTKALLYQTGLSQVGLERVGLDAEKLRPYQEAFFADVEIDCSFNSIISKQEQLVGSVAPLVPLEDGDILISPCSHVSGWRNGHAAIVVDSEEGLTLESIVLGQNSSIVDVFFWRLYPAFLVFRLKDSSAQERAEIAQNAAETLLDIPYGFTVGVLSPKYQEGVRPQITQCSHLVWNAYRQFGYDLDSDGGGVVTPHDIANSPELELVQVYGMNPETLWE